MKGDNEAREIKISSIDELDSICSNLMLAVAKAVINQTGHYRCCWNGINTHFILVN